MAGRMGKAAFLLLMVAAAICPAVYAQAAHRERKKPPAAPKSLEGSISDGVYRNPYFGFSYKVSFGWVDRTEVMRQSDSEAPASVPSKSQVLLAVFERPPEAPRATINAGLVIAIESATAYPGLKEAGDYFGPLEQVTGAKGFKVVNEPYEFPVGQTTVAREDFSKEEGEMTMHQSCLVILQKSYLVSFTFVSDSDDAMDELLGGLSFHGAPSTSKPPAAPSKK